MDGGLSEGAFCHPVKVGGLALRPLLGRLGAVVHGSLWMANGRQLTQLYLDYARVNRRLLLSPEVADRVLVSSHPRLAVRIHQEPGASV